MIWSALFTVGNFLYGRTEYGLALLGVFVGGGLTLLYVMNQLWAGTSVREAVPVSALEQEQPK